MARRLNSEDILSMNQYSRERRDHALQIAIVKKNRRMPVGPDAMFYFENFETMWFQVHEMLYIEKGGAKQIPGELATYNPLIPNGRELVATMMIEIPDPDRRAATLANLGGIENTILINVEGETIIGRSEESDRTDADGKASSVQFIHFPFTDAQVAEFSQPNADITLAINHPKYRHMAGLTEDFRSSLSQDFD